jgi:hypothetical protein
MTRKLYVLLGRYGDIINLLPLMQHEFKETGQKPILMVAEQFASLLDGVSYVEPVIWTGSWEDFHAAMFWAKQVHPEAEIMSAAIYGRGKFIRHCTHDFNRESWRYAGARVPWGRLPLEFDRRGESDRERQLAARYPGKILVSLGAKSSPLAGRRALLALIRQEFGPENVVDISEFPLFRLYDLIGLFDRAACLVSADSAPLHLAAASPRLPVVALINRSPERWYGSAWHPQHAATFFYDEHAARESEIIEAIRAPDKAAVRLVHVYDSTVQNSETTRRETNAKVTWAEEYRSDRWTPAPTNLYLPRDARSIGERVDLPFIQDMIAHGRSKLTKSKDIIVLTNADVCFTPGLTGWLIEQVTRSSACFARRWDCFRRETPFVSEAQVMEECTIHDGTDLVAFTGDWWDKHGAKFPDMVLGRESWDLVFRLLIKLTHGGEIVGGIYHERHESPWLMNRDVMGNFHNNALCNEFLLKYGVPGANADHGTMASVEATMGF